MRHWIVVIGIVLLVIAAFTAIAWCISTPDFEPFVSLLTLIAAITGLVIDRWLGERERRTALLRSLAHEVYINLQIMNNPLFQKEVEKSSTIPVFPRFYLATLQSTISSGTFATEKDEKLFKLMHGLLQRSIEFNHRLDITEFQIFSKPTPEVISQFREKLSSGQAFSAVRQSLTELSKLLIDQYSNESGIRGDTVLFDESNTQKRM